MLKDCFVKPRMGRRVAVLVLSVIVIGFCVAVFEQLGVGHGDRVEISIKNDTRTVYKNILAYARSFADVYVGEPLVYVNSLDCVAVAINQGSFARAYNIGTGNSWRIRIEPFKGFV